MAARTTSLLITILSILIAFSSSFKPPEAPCGTAVYWGRNSSEGSLSATCATGYYNYVNIAFLTIFGGDQIPFLNLTDHCCAAIGGCRFLSEEIRYCQSLDIKVLLSIGSAYGSYYLTSPQDALAVTDYLWNNFLSGNPNGPLGDVALDGIDFVLESPQSPLYWDMLAKDVSNLSKLGRKIYLSAAPQCNRTIPYWEAAFKTGVFDYVWVQFYNNKTCDFGGGIPTLLKSWNEWSDALVLAGAQLFLGLPVAPNGSATSYSYIPPEILIDEVFPAVKRSPNYGGMMVWNRYMDVTNNYSARVNEYVCRNFTQQVPYIKMVSEN